MTTTATSTMLQPVCKVVLDGVDLTARIMPRLSSLTITTSRQDHADELNLEFTDTDGRVAMPRTGVELEVMLGFAGTGVRIQGTYTVDEVEHRGTPDTFSIRARSAKMASGIRTRKERNWSNTTVGHLVSVIAGENGLQARVSDKLASIAVTQIDQTESDMAMLRRLGRMWDAVATVKAGCLVFAPIGQGQTAGGAALATVTLTRSSGDRHRYHAADRDAYTGVRARWHDVDAARAKSSLAGASGHVKVLRGNFASEEDATREAQAEMARVKRGACTFELQLAVGRPDIYPEMPVSVKGWGAVIDATDWIVTKTTHSLDGNNGYTTAIELENKATASDNPAAPEADDGDEDSST